MDANEILVLHQGRIVERGTHMQLIDLKGEYARMWALQQQRAEAEEALARTASP
jgi:ATP-binding cassette, subfamily B, heavy metal transporter